MRIRSRTTEAHHRRKAHKTATANFSMSKQSLTSLLDSAFDVRGLATVYVPCRDTNRTLPSSNWHLSTPLHPTADREGENAEDLLTDNPTATLSHPQNQKVEVADAAIALETLDVPRWLRDTLHSFLPSRPRRLG